MDKQDIFNRVAKHLLTQKVKSQGDNGRCFYRGPNGLKCAIGALIKDEFYDPKLEGTSACQSSILDALIKSGIDCTEDGEFLAHLQVVHDVDEPIDWRSSLRSCAASYHLDASVLDELQPI